MIRMGSLRCTWVGWCALLAAAGGCAATRGTSPTVADISPARQSRKQQAVRDFEQQRDQAQYQAAVTCWEQGNFEDCQQELGAVLKRNPEHLEANRLLAELYLLNQQPAEARLILERLVQSHADDAQLHHLLSRVLESSGEREQSLVHAREAARLQPEKESYHDYLASLETGDHNAAKTELAAYRQPGDESGRLEGYESQRVAEAFAAALQRRDLHQAKTLLLSAAQRARGDEARLISLAVTALRHDQSAWAIQVLRTFQSPETASAAYRRALATAYYHAGEYAAAETQLRQALLLDKRSALSYFLLGCTLSRQQRQSEAETHLRQAALLDPRYDRAPLLP
jgi:Flp pilus assembly protein TadD